MSESSNVQAQRIRSSGDLRSRVESQICDACTDLCWSLEIWAYDLLGEDAKACLLYREHLPTQSDALLILGRWWMRQGTAVSRAESAAWLLEHQGSLFG